MRSKFGLDRILIRRQAFYLLLDKRHRVSAIGVACLIDRQVTVAIISERAVAETVGVHVGDAACLPCGLMRLLIDLIVVNVIGLDPLE